MVDGYLLWFLVCFGSKYENPFLFEQVLGHIPLYNCPSSYTWSGTGYGQDGDLLQIDSRRFPWTIIIQQTVICSFQVHGEETFIGTKVPYIISPSFLTCPFSLPLPPYTNHLHSCSWTTVKCRPWAEEWVCQRTAPVTVIPLEGSNWKYLNRIWIVLFQKCWEEDLTMSEKLTICSQVTHQLAHSVVVIP